MARPPYSSRTLAYVRARATANMLDTVRVLRRAAPVLDEDTLLLTTSVGATIYQGAARIYNDVQGAALIVGESVQATSATTISLPWTATGVHVDDIVLVLTSATDTDLVGDAFLVKDVTDGGLLRSTRALSCVAYQASRWWE